MSWIKRNLYFLIGGVTAALLLGLAGFYFYSKWSLNNENLEKLEAAYADWERISNLSPNPGNEKVDNIKLAREQQREVRTEFARLQKSFAPIPPVPNPAKGVVTKEEFASALRRTIDQLQKDASLGGVTLPPKYDFAFQAERNLPNFAPGSLQPLSAQLGDIKTICTFLFRAKVNSLDAVRRERVSTDDQSGPQADYLDVNHVSVTNDLAILVPYEVTFRCFSAELAGTLSAFGSSSNGIIVKSVNVEPASGVTSVLGDQYNTPGAMGYPPGTPGYPASYYGEAAMMGRPMPVATPAPVTRGGLQTILDEKPLKVTLVLNVVRLLPTK